MLEQILFSFNMVLPIFLIIALGAWIRRRNVVSPKTFRELNHIVFHVFLPCLVFNSISNAVLERAFNLRFGLFIFSGITLGFLVAMFIVPKLVKDPNQQGVVVQAMIRGNFVIVGLPILTRLFGAVATEPVGLILLISMPIYNITSVLALEGLRGEVNSFKSLLLKLLQNPMIIATVLGFIGLFVRLPELVASPIRMIAGASSAISLFCLGGMLELSSMKANRRILNGVSFVKLVLLPMIVFPIGYFLGMDQLSLTTLMVFFAAPPAVATFPMVQKCGGDEELAGQLILYTTMISVFSYAFWVGFVRYMFL